MTDVLERLPEPLLDDAVAGDVAQPGDRSARTALAVVVALAAAIHVATAPPHLEDSTVLGLGFLAAAWAQLAVAWAALARPARRVWTAAIVLHVVLVAVWAVSRTAGLPFGEHAGHPEDVTIVDLTTVGLQVAAVLLAARLLLFRGAGIGRALAIGIPVLALGATSVALASPDARSHAHGAHGEAGDHAHGEATDALAAKGFGSFMNGHEHGHVEVVLDPATQARLDEQLAVTREVAAQFPTLQDAVDAGYRRAGPYVPGLGLHLIKFAGAEYLNLDGVMDEEDLRHPLSLLYLSHEPDAPLAGFMYYAATAVEPTGFAGRNDGWHYHENLCAVPSADGFLDFPFGPDFGATQEQCDAVGGNLLDSQWMVHVWTVPGWDDMEGYGGVFAEMSPYLGCSDGTYFSRPFEEWIDNLYNVCSSGASAQLDPRVEG
ncbi:MAG TPA: hypothetical protein VM262_09025 [Acidimicrobiales bacterium]|nr:hypothetical protein [Acidimicrobiales bacterium]